jgi:tRNA (guanine37-N1)-methyltransferase
MLFDILTLFPSMFDAVLGESIVGRAVEKGLVTIHVQDIREYTIDRHKTVDDYPYGGDPGMLMKPEPLALAITAARKRLESAEPCVVFLTPQGMPLDQQIVKELAAMRALILLCGHYKGIDQRIRDRYIDREISIGDYVLSGGEIPAMVLVDSITRLIPGVLGNRDSAERDSFFSGLLAPPQYTRPEEFEGMRVPDVLLSGHHENIRRWQRCQAEEVTMKRRPDLWAKHCSENVEQRKRDS